MPVQRKAAPQLMSKKGIKGVEEFDLPPLVSFDGATQITRVKVPPVKALGGQKDLIEDMVWCRSWDINLGDVCFKEPVSPEQ
jgi:hypothetical protein